MSERVQLSAKTRFDVFKRDGFMCQYCGDHPPNALLHVDHIHPVAEGGDNDPDNLVTSCQRCNLGKGARLLSAVPQSLSDKAAEVAEREAQIAGYSDVMQEARDRLESDVWRVADELEPGASENGYNRRRFQSVKNFVTRLGVHQVLDAADIAVAKNGTGSARCFKYFCGICWNKIREIE